MQDLSATSNRDSAHRLVHRRDHPQPSAPQSVLPTGSAISPALFDAIIGAPALPTVYPIGADALRGFAEALAMEQYPALEVLARPLDEMLPMLRDVFAGPERQKVYWGIGTLKSRTDALAAAKLTPDFFVSPAFSRRVLEVAIEAEIPYIPAVHTFQDVQNVIDAFDEFGLTVQLLKLCPVYGLSADYVRSLSGCFPGISFCPTGEVTLSNYVHWKRMPAIVAPMGSRLIPQELLESSNFSGVRERLRLLRELARCNLPKDPRKCPDHEAT